MTPDSSSWSPAASSQGDYGQFAYQGGQGDFARTLSLNRSNSSALDMRQLTRALTEAREGSGQVRDALLSASFRPRLPGLTKIVSKLSKEGSWRKALEVYEVVDELGLRPDTALTNSAISACDKGGRWQKALEIFDRMEPLGLPRDAITYSATISALAKGKQWHAALQIFDQMQYHGVEADVVTCCSLINALERGGQWQMAEKLFLEMCTVQEEQEQLAALVRAAPSVPPGLGFGTGAGAVAGGSSPSSSLARSHTSPSSVLIALRSGSAGTGTGLHGGLPPVNESSGTGTGSPSELDLTLSLSAQQGVLDALVDGVAEKDQEGSKRGASAFAAAAGSSTVAGSHSVADSDDLATAFARVTSLTATSPNGSVGPGFDKALSATLGRHGSGMNHFANPFAAASTNAGAGLGGRESTPPPPPGLVRAGSATSGYSFGSGSVNENTGAFSTQGSGLLGNHRQPSLPPPPPSRLQRGTFGREAPVNGPVQAAAAAHLRRAMSCFPDFDANNNDATGSINADGSSNPSQNLTAMFNFSHAARVSPNRVCCNALLAAYARAKPPQWQRAVHLLQAMWSGGPTLVPDVVSYNTALKACANAFQLSKGIEIYHEMRRNGVYPNATSYNCLIAAASDASNQEVMLEVGNWLSTSAGEVQATCMNAYVTGLVKVGLWNEALTQFHNMLAPNAPAHPTSATFCTIMAGHMTAGDYSAVQRTFEYMRASGVSPNIMAFNTLLAALAALGDWMVALDVLNAALAAAVEGVHANTATFNTVLAALNKGANAPGAVGQYPFLASQAVQVFQQMQSVRGGASPDATTFNTLISILDATKHSTQVVAVYNLMAGAGLTPDGTAGQKVLAAAIETGQIAKAVQVTRSLYQLQNISIEPQQLSTVLGACFNAGAWDLATQLCSAAHSAQGAGVAAAMSNFVLRSALDAGQFALAMEIINIMQSMGVEVEKSVAHTILQSGQSGSNTTTLASSGADGVLNNSREGGGGSTNTATDFSTFEPRRVSSAGTGNSYPHHQHATVVFKAENQPIHSETSGVAATATAAAALVQRSSSTGNPLGVSMHFPITPQLVSSPGANISPESPHRIPQTNSLGSHTNALAVAGLPSSGGGGGAIDAHHLHRTSSEAEGYLSIVKDDPYTTTKNSNNNASMGAFTSNDLDQQQLTLADTNALLASLESTGDAAGCVEILTNMKAVGIVPNIESYHHVITALVNAGEGSRAVEVCKEGHEAGILKHCSTSNVGKEASLVGNGAVEPAESKVVDLRGCKGEVAVVVAIMWLSKLKNNDTNRKGNEESSTAEIPSTAEGKMINKTVRFVFGPLENSQQQEHTLNKEQHGIGRKNSVDWHAVRAEVQRVLTTGQSSIVPSLSGLALDTVPTNAIKFAVEGPCAILEVQVQPQTTTWSAAAATAGGSSGGESSGGGGGGGRLD